METNKKSWLKHILLFLAILGPGIITGSVDNDAGGITTYSVAGSIYGYKLLWTLIPAFIVLAAVQEMNARMGIVTGKGLADLIRENFSIKITFFILVGLVLADIGNTATEFAGIAGSMQIFGVSKYVSVPLSALAVWFLIVKGTYRTAEKIFLILSVFLLVYIVSALLSKPDWNEVGLALLSPTVEFNSDYLKMVIGIIGTTIAPWMQFYMQSAVIEKGIKIEEYKYELWDVLIGAFLTILVAFFIIVACASTLHKNGIEIKEASDAAVALEPFAGRFASALFAFGLFVASFFSATILPLATAFYICEALGFEAGVNKTFREAPQFYGLFSFIILTGVIIILIPGSPLIQITLWTQVINGFLLPVVLISMLIMVNKKKIMGPYVNTWFKNLIGFPTALILIVLAGILTVETIISWFF